MYIPREHLCSGYRNRRILAYDYFMLGMTDPGFYCSWDGVFYLTKSKKIFSVDTPLSYVYLSKNVYVTRDNNPVIFSCLIMENLYSEVFSQRDYESVCT
jgi:hypothetical protein